MIDLQFHPRLGWSHSFSIVIVPIGYFRFCSQRTVNGLLLINSCTMSVLVITLIWRRIKRRTLFGRNLEPLRPLLQCTSCTQFGRLRAVMVQFPIAASCPTKLLSGKASNPIWRQNIKSHFWKLLPRSGPATKPQCGGTIARTTCKLRLGLISLPHCCL